MNNNKINWDSFSFITFVEKELKNSFIILNEKDVVIVKVNTFEDMFNIDKYVTETPWCIAHYERFWEGYVTMTNNHQYVCFDFSKKNLERNSMYAFTLQKVKGNYIVKYMYDGHNENVLSSEYKWKYIIDEIISKTIENILSYSNN